MLKILSIFEAFRFSVYSDKVFITFSYWSKIFCTGYIRILKHIYNNRFRHLSNWIIDTFPKINFVRHSRKARCQELSVCVRTKSIWNHWRQWSLGWTCFCWQWIIMKFSQNFCYFSIWFTCSFWIFYLREHPFFSVLTVLQLKSEFLNLFCNSILTIVSSMKQLRWLGGAVHENNKLISNFLRKSMQNSIMNIHSDEINLLNLRFCFIRRMVSTITLQESW